MRYTNPQFTLPLYFISTVSLPCEQCAVVGRSLTGSGWWLIATDDVEAFRLDGDVTEPSELPGLFMITLSLSLDCGHDLLLAVDVLLPAIVTRSPSVTISLWISIMLVLFLYLGFFSLRNYLVSFRGWMHEMTPWRYPPEITYSLENLKMALTRTDTIWLGTGVFSEGISLGCIPSHLRGYGSLLFILFLY